MKILAITLGSIGDLMPFLAVAEALRARGHQVLFAANSGYTALVQGAGFAFTAIWDRAGQSLDDVLADDPEEAWHRVHQQMLIPAAQPSFDFITHHAAQGPCVVLANWSALGARQAHAALGVPLCSVYLSPGAVARDDAAPAGTERHCAVGFFPDWFGMPPPGKECAVIPTGFPMFDEALIPPLPAPLEDFLRQGPAPVIFTPGSFMRHANDFFEVGLAACARLGLRAVLLSPYRHTLPQRLPANAMHFPYIALQRLAPRAAALVSHGGIGTIAQGLAAGIPQLTTPVFFDQADNVARLVALGVGDRVTPVTADTMTAKLAAVLASAPIQAACARIRAGMRDPRAQICDLVEKMGRAG